jgi:NADH:ubiquinone oxidoreductase subunit 6 (subunit J)
MYSIFSFISLIVFLFTFLISHDVEFIAIAFLIIYIGAIMVLFLFVIFLINLYNIENVKLRTTQITTNLTLWFSLLGSLVLIKGFIVFWFLSTDVSTTLSVISPLGGNMASDFDKYTQTTLLATLKVDLLHFYDINTIGYLIYSKFKLYLSFCAIILFVALIGSVLLISTKK